MSFPPEYINELLKNLIKNELSTRWGKLNLGIISLIAMIGLIYGAFFSNISLTLLIPLTVIIYPFALITCGSFGSVLQEFF